MDGNSTTINGVLVEKEGDVTHFSIPKDCSKPREDKSEENVGFFRRILNWFSFSKVTPYAKVRDPSDPLYKRSNSADDYDAGSDGAIGAEIGIKIRF